MLKSRTPRLAALALALPLMVGLLSACTTSASSPESAPSPSSSAKKFENARDYQLALAACMRESGADMPDPKENELLSIEGDKAMAAIGECSKKLGKPPVSEADQKAADEATAKWPKIAACLREHGVNVPDPAPGQMPGVPGNLPDEAQKCFN